MANFDLLVVGAGGKPTRKRSIDQAIDFGSVRIGASNLEISEDTGKFDFDAKVLSNIANGTASGEALSFSQIGVAGGIASLDGGGKIPASQLPNSVMELQGEWDADANDPVLEDGTGNAGDVYEVTEAGDQDLGSGSQHFDVGDFVIYGASGVWYRSDSTDAVASVNGYVGVVSLDSDDIAEGSTNKYYTATQARADLIASSIVDADTTHAPSGEAVFEALADKSDVGHTHVAADVTDFDSAALAAAVQSGAITDSVTKAPTHDAVFDALALKANVSDISSPSLSKTNDNAGTISVRQVVYVKANGNVDLADSSAVDLVDACLGLVRDATIATTAAGLITFAKGDIIPGFTGLTPGKKYYVSNATPGAIALYSALTWLSGQSVCKVGKALSATQLEFDPEFEFEF